MVDYFNHHNALDIIVIIMSAINTMVAFWGMYDGINYYKYSKENIEKVNEMIKEEQKNGR